MTYLRRPAPHSTSPNSWIAFTPPSASPWTARAWSPPSPRKSPARTASCAPLRIPSLSARRPDDCRHLQVAQEFGGRRCRSFRFRLPLRFEKQRGLVEKALPNHRRATAPGGIQLPGLPGVAVMLGERRGHPPAVLQIDACRRDQILHRHVRGDFALAHLLLNGLRQKLDQRQPPRHPAHAAVKPARQFIQSIAEALLHLRQQPALLQGGLMLGKTQ